MRHHREDRSTSTQRALNLLHSLLPDDSFSKSQWQVGLEYYRRRIEEITQGDSPQLLVDLGCGAGNWSIAGSRLFKTVIGVDVNARRLNAARHIASTLHATNIQFCECPIETAPISKRTADCVLLCNVLPYVQNWRACLTCAGDYLRDGGSLLVGWVDVGIVFYTLLEAALTCSRSRLADFCRMTVGRMINGTENRPALWIPKKSVGDFTAELCANRTLYTGRQPRSNDHIPRMLPRRFVGASFYHEFILNKQIIQ